jgi:hypothetical protein
MEFDAFDRPEKQRWDPVIPVVFGFVLLIIVVSNIVLFAMMAELSSRVPAQAASATWARPDEAIRLGVTPATWPPGLVRQRDKDRGLVLVLSPVCESCRSIAAQLAADDDGEWRDASLLVSASNEPRGTAFINEYRLGRFASHVDANGQWVSESFGVATSPTALVFSQGRLQEAYSFNDLHALRSELKKVSRDSQLIRKEVA